MAQEEEWIELLIANERVGKWVDAIRDATNHPLRRKLALLALQSAVVSKEAYAEEARQAGAVQLLTRLLARTGIDNRAEWGALKDDDEVLDAAASILSACSGPQASGGKVTDYEYDGCLVRVKQGALGDGVGSKVWSVSHNLCRELTQNRQIVADRRVLELGSGCGVCGILAAKLGARSVVLSDYAAAILANLRTCMQLNTLPKKSASAAVISAIAADFQSQRQLQAAVADQPSSSAADMPSHASCAEATMPAANGQGHSLASTIAPVPGKLFQSIQAPASDASVLGAAAATTAASTITSIAAAPMAKNGPTTATTWQAHQLQGHVVPDDDELFDDAEWVDDFDLANFVSGGHPCGSDKDDAVLGGGGLRSLGGSDTSLHDRGSVEDGCSSSSWCSGSMSIRHVDWYESLHLMGPASNRKLTTSTAELATLDDSNAAEAGGPIVDLAAEGMGKLMSSPPEVSGLDGVERETEGSSAWEMPPPLASSEKFEVLLGSDILYEAPHAKLVPAVVQHRLQAGGCCLLTVAVRDQTIIDTFAAECCARGLRYRLRRIQPLRGYDGIVGRQTDYEGGFLMIALDHITSPCPDWHSDDFETPKVAVPTLGSSSEGT